MNTELLISNIILTLGTWSILLLVMVKITKIEQVNQSFQEKTSRAIRRIEELLLDGGGKQINFTGTRKFQDILDDQAFQDALMKNYIKESINEIIENSRYFDEDYKPTSGTIQYGYAHNGAPQNVEDWYLNKQKKNKDSAEVPRDRDGRGKLSKS